MKISNYDSLAYGDVSGTNSKTMTFNETLRFTGYQGASFNMDDTDPNDITYGNIENLQVLSFYTDTQNCAKLHKKAVAPTPAQIIKKEAKESEFTQTQLIIVIVVSSMLFLLLVSVFCCTTPCCAYLIYKDKKGKWGTDGAGDITRRSLLNDIEM